MNASVKCEGGFTLLEVLIAAAILSLIGAMVFGAFNGVVSSGAGVEKRSEMYHTARFIIRKMTEDLSSASLFVHNANGKFVGKDSEGGDAAQTDEVRFTGFGRRILFANTGSDEAEIAWYVLTSDDKKQRVLMRSENPDIFSAQPLEDKMEQLDVTDRIKSFDVKYLVSGEWKDGFDSRTTRATPNEVLVEFELEDKDGFSLKSKTLIPIGGGA